MMCQGIKLIFVANILYEVYFLLVGLWRLAVAPVAVAERQQQTGRVTPYRAMKIIFFKDKMQVKVES